MDRVLSAARLHVTRPLATIGLTWLIVAVAVAINVLVWRSTPQDESGAGTGAVFILAFVVLVTYVQAVTQLLPFGMGMGLSRRSFYAGTALAAVLLSAAYGLALTVLAGIERATGGWGVDLAFFAPRWIDAGDPALQWLVFTAVLLLAATVGTGIGVVFKRFGPTGMYLLTAATIVAVGGGLALVGLLDAWQQVGSWFTDQSLLVPAVVLPALLTVTVAGLSYAGLRRVVP